MDLEDVDSVACPVMTKFLVLLLSAISVMAPWRFFYFRCTVYQFAQS